MNTRYPLALSLAAILAMPAWTLARASCHATTGPLRYSLLELYTSEGCSSCPPAERGLSALRGGDAARRVALAFHVDYWDGLGWADRFAQPAYAARQRWLAGVAAGRTVYTPQFVLDGRDAGPAVPSPGTDAGPPGVELGLDLVQVRDDLLEVAVQVRRQTAMARPRLFIALYENDLDSRVVAGENAGRRLHHDFVVRSLEGPIALPDAPDLPVRRQFGLDRSWKRADLGVAVFVQDLADGRVHQALARDVCRQ